MELRPRRSAALQLLLAAWFVRPCLSWGEAGHERIARIAQELLTDGQRRKVRTMLKGDMVEAAGFEAKTRRVQPRAQSIHYHHQEPQWSCDTGLGLKGTVHCDEGMKSADRDSLLCWTAGMFRKYSHDAVLQSFSNTKDPLWVGDETPDWMGRFSETWDWEAIGVSAVAKRNLTSVLASPSDGLKMLVTLLGDMHQPMHWASNYNYGFNTTVAFRGQEHSLHDFWEKYIPDQLGRSPKQQPADPAFLAQAARWREHFLADNFRTWALEMAAHSCNDIFGVLKQRDSDGSADVPKRVELTEEQYHRWADLATEIMQLSGQRLAFLLEELISHQRHKDAHTKDGRGIATRHRQRRTPATNLAIAVVLVPSLILGLRSHERSGGPSLFGAFTKHLKM